MKIFGLEITNIKKKDFLKEICSFNDRKIIFTPNPEILLELKKDKNFKKVLEKADFLLPDWIGLYIAAQILNNKNLWFFNLFLLPYYFFNLFFRRKYLYSKYWERICWSDITRYLLDYSEKNDIHISIIDLYVWWENLSLWDINKIYNQKIFEKKLKKEFPKLKFDYFIYNPEKKDEIIKNISISTSKILFSTLGMKSQEESVIEIMKKCDNLKLWLWVWSSFDYITWLQKRAPKIFSSIGIEWLYRLFTWPGKINRLKRLWNAIFVFTWKVIITKNK